MSVNPYQPSPTTSDQIPSAQDRSPILLYVLCGLVALHLLCFLAMTIVGLLFQVPAALIGGVVSIGFYFAIFIGLIMKAEWARVCLIWLCYVEIVTCVFQVQTAMWLVIPLTALQVVTLIIAHNHRVRQVTQGASFAVSYTYQETDQNPDRSATE